MRGGAGVEMTAAAVAVSSASFDCTQGGLPPRRPHHYHYGYRYYCHYHYDYDCETFSTYPLLMGNFLHYP